jgi:hypothetical protein
MIFARNLFRRLTGQTDVVHSVQVFPGEKLVQCHAQFYGAANGAIEIVVAMFSREVTTTGEFDAGDNRMLLTPPNGILGRLLQQEDTRWNLPLNLVPQGPHRWAVARVNAAVSANGFVAFEIE